MDTTQVRQGNGEGLGSVAMADPAGKTAGQASDERASARQTSERRDDFMVLLGHVLREPLTHIDAALTIMQRQGKLDVETRAYLALIRRNVDLQTRLVDDLVDLAGLKRGTFELRKGPVEIQAVVNSAVEICRPDLDARHFNYSIDHKGPPHIVSGDGKHLGRVFWNLIRNAIRFTPAGGRIRIRSWREDGEVLVEVSDSGPGISPETIDHIFDAFENVDGENDGEVGGLGLGLGLGLAVSEAMVEIHGGKIEVFSEGKDRGARFTVRLPIATAAQVLSPGSGNGDGAGK